MFTCLYCCGRKSRAACAQSFALWQQATTEINRRDHSIIACSGHIYIVFFFTHIPFLVNHTFNATPPERLQQHPPPSFLQRTALIARSFCKGSTWYDLPHPGHSTILLRSEIPSGMCTKLRTVAASNNRDHPTRSLYYCLFVPHIYSVFLHAHPVCGESHI